MATSTASLRAKGLRGQVPAQLSSLSGKRIDDAKFAWPLLTLDEAALQHNIDTAAQAIASRGVLHAPHVKTHMSPELWQRQAEAGAWGATVANPDQLRTAAGWGAQKLFLANQFMDPREAEWLRQALEGEVAGVKLDKVLIQVDSAAGVGILAQAFAIASPEVKSRLGVLVEFGVVAGRTGVRTLAEVQALGQKIVDSGLNLAGVTGYEGPVAPHTDEGGRQAVAAWCHQLKAAAELLRPLINGPMVVSAGGSAFLDVILAELGPLADSNTNVIVRSGAYVTHDHGHYAEADPWQRIPGAAQLKPAITVLGQVLSVPEPGLALLGVGRRDISFDLDLPYPLYVRQQQSDGHLGPQIPLPATAKITALNDQHAFLAFDGEQTQLHPGDVVGLGISHPCTTLDKWRFAAITDGDIVTEIYNLDF